MPNRKPLQVYLDSADYSNLAKRIGSSEYQEQYERLKSLSHDGVIIVRYSAINILESAHINRDHLEYASARADVIESLCVGNTLLPYTKLHQLECSHVLQDKVVDRESVYRYDHQWLSDFSGFAVTIENQLIESIRKDLNGESRKKRREFEKKMFKKGKIRKEHLTNISKTVDSASLDFSTKYPFVNSKYLGQCIREYMLGSISAKRFSILLSRECLSPINFTRQYYDTYRQQTDAQADIIRSQGEAFLKLVSQFRSEVEGLVELSNSLGRSPAEIKQKLHSIRSDWLTRRDEYLGGNISKSLSEELLLPSSEIRNFLSSTNPGTLASLDFTIQLLWQFAIQLTSDKKRKLSISDMGDVLHASYVPYIDVFRADKRMKPIIENVCKEQGFDTHIFASLHELIDHIDKIKD